MEEIVAHGFRVLQFLDENSSDMSSRLPNTAKADERKRALETIGDTAQFIERQIDYESKCRDAALQAEMTGM
ncbi:hypothetical protein PsorP6_004916 [Peronosclerospora sorghi]|uniref:Uncharacterized protein n=1 Tax=Peronosclerospora sorghi TaxID=230839 RepID=A0ACC0W452_9STRA|nr:hypothetical protein PsorP6_004916 [Peronosclerospora sorghi]